MNKVLFNKIQAQKEIPFIRGFPLFKSLLYDFVRDFNKSIKYITNNDILVKNIFLSTILYIVGSIFSLFLFILLPSIITNYLKNLISIKIILGLIESIFRILFFTLFIYLIRFIPCIKEIYMYHSYSYNLKKENLYKNINDLNSKCFDLYMIISTSILLLSLLNFNKSYFLGILIRIIIFPIIVSLYFEIKNILHPKMLNKFIVTLTSVKPTNEFLNKIKNKGVNNEQRQ